MIKQTLYEHFVPLRVRTPDKRSSAFGPLLVSLSAYN